MASILLKLGRFEEAEKIYRSLLFMNPDNYRYVILHKSPSMVFFFLFKYMSFQFFL